MSKKGKLPKRMKHRRKTPIFTWKKKKLFILCPFCEQKHTISPESPSPCGTILELSAVQETWKSARCVLCGVVDNDPMIKIGENYRHIKNCSPGRKIYTIPPKPRLSARLAYFLPSRVHLWMLKTFGVAPTAITSGEKISGYHWDTP